MKLSQELSYLGVYIETKLLKPKHIKFIKKYFQASHQGLFEEEFSYKWINLYKYNALLMCLGSTIVNEKLLIFPNKLFTNIQSKLK